MSILDTNFSSILCLSFPTVFKFISLQSAISPVTSPNYSHPSTQFLATYNHHLATPHPLPPTLLTLPTSPPPPQQSTSLDRA